jgi:UDP-N-acetylmuramate--alanine ligase
MKKQVSHIHFVGIGGVGMSGIAEVFLNLGFFISGSDLHSSATLDRLKRMGACVFVGHAAPNVVGADVVVTSSAISADNPEIIEAKHHRIPIVQRAVMLAELMRFRKGIAVAGTHGKTTTTSLAASVLAEGGLDPTYVIGGRLSSSGSHAKLGEGEYIVVEADESDASFLNLMPLTAIVTNIDQDHMETYGHDVGKLRDVFLHFLERLPFYGRAILCVDDVNIRTLLPSVQRPVLTYGIDQDADFRATNIQSVGLSMQFVLERFGREVGLVHLNLTGRHNVANALSVIALAYDLGIDDQSTLKALSSFKGVGRRFSRYEVKRQKNEKNDGALSFTLIDDYGHHPVEVEATLAAARGAYPDKKLILVFQPHRYTRTRDLFEDFVRVLGHADLVVLTEVYAAGEQPLPKADAKSLAHALRVAARVEPVFVERIEDVPDMLFGLVQAGDVVLSMGAGSIGQLPQLMNAQSCVV